MRFKRLYMLQFFKHKHTNFSLGTQLPKFSSDWFSLLAYLFMFLLRVVFCIVL